MTENGHVPVLLKEVLENVGTIKDGVFVDGTFGGGGYTRALLEAGAKKVIALDRDPEAIERGQKMVEEFGERLQLIETQFSKMEDVVIGLGIKAVDGILLDVGVSSFQIDTPSRGFSFRFDAPLDMRMEKQGPTAANILATKTQEELTKIFWELGEEKNARRIAQKIVQRRDNKPIETTNELSALVEEVNPKWKNAGRHPAMRVFQALRIYVNRELGELEDALLAGVHLLKPGGRLCVVSFHSLEDRITKKFMRQKCGLEKQKAHLSVALPIEQEKADYMLPFKKAIEPSEQEIRENPRSRSSKLRVMERVK